MANTAKSVPPKEDTPKSVKLRYLGSSGRYIDPESGAIFERDGSPQEVSPEVATRLQSPNPYDQFEEVRS